MRVPKLNSVILSGRLTRDIELKYLPNGTAVAKMSIAFDRSFKKGDEWIKETSYIDCTVWAKLAENCANNLHKGSPVVLEGYIQTRNYVDKNDNKRKSVDIVAHRVHFLESNDEPVQGETTKPNISDDNGVPF